MEKKAHDWSLGPRPSGLPHSRPSGTSRCGLVPVDESLLFVVEAEVSLFGRLDLGVRQATGDSSWVPAIGLSQSCPGMADGQPGQSCCLSDGREWHQRGTQGQARKTGGCSAARLAATGPTGPTGTLQGPCSGGLRCVGWPWHLGVSCTWIPWASPSWTVTQPYRSRTASWLGSRVLSLESGQVGPLCIVNHGPSLPCLPSLDRQLTLALPDRTGLGFFFTFPLPSPPLYPKPSPPYGELSGGGQPAGSGQRAEAVEKNIHRGVQSGGFGLCCWGVSEQSVDNQSEVSVGEHHLI